MDIAIAFSRIRGTFDLLPMDTKPRSNRRIGWRILYYVGVVLIGLAFAASYTIGGSGYAWNRAKASKTKIQFIQWFDAMEMYRQSYGHYPPIGGLDLSGKSTGYIDAERFSIALTGQHFDGTAVPPSASDEEKVGNLQLKQFYGIGQNEVDRETLGGPFLQDAFGNIQFVVLFDTNGDGIINAADLPGGKFPPVTTVEAPDRGLVPKIDPAKGIKTSILIYSAGRGESADNIVLMPSSDL